MMILFQLVCLLITLYVLQKYIVTGTYSGNHRLLPLVLGLIGVYNFYEVVQCITNEVALFTGLKELLLIQMLYLLAFYAIDFLNMKLPRLVESGLFVSLLFTNGIILLQYDRPEAYRKYFLAFVFGYIILCLSLGTYAYVRYSFSKQERQVANMVYLALLIPAVSLCLEKLGAVKGELIMPFSLACTCGIILYLIREEKLVEPLLILQENQYDTSDIAVIFFDADYYYLGANQAARFLFPEELSTPPRERRPDSYIDMIKDMARNLDRQREIEVQGRFYKCQMTSVYYHGRLRGYSLSLLDITSQKKETRLMSSLKNAAETQNVRKSRFLAAMSHDLRSPLHAIIGISDILMTKKEISARNRSLLLHLRRAGNSLLEQVDSILDFSKLEAGKLELTRNRYSLEQIAEELAHMCVINLQSKPVHFSLAILTEYPKELIGDNMRVREIIQNLLSNAVKFTETGEICCEISCNCQPEVGRAYITCSVADTGFGMTEKQLEQIFQEYVSFSDGRNSEGIGLGLCIVRQLAEMMGGSVTAYSDGKSGSKITVSFYQEMDQEKMCPAVSFTSETILQQSAGFKYHVKPSWIYPKARVLLADDMKINQEIFREIAGPWRFEIDFVSNGKAAVEAVRRRSYQLIFLDQMMPEMTGDEAAKRIHGFCDTVLILVTADLSDDTRKECKKHGFSDFIAKPMNVTVFQKTVERYMPKEYRQEAPLENDEQNVLEGVEDIRAYGRTLQTFVQEVRSLAEKLAESAEEDLDYFRVKVHGIKGVSRQIGRSSVSESAEIMEMAAKTENRGYIRSHLPDFLRELKETAEDVERELSRLPQPKDEAEKTPSGSQELFLRLKEGFDAYDIKQIEECIRRLDETVLSAKENRLLEQARAACAELDYEGGSALF